MDSKLTATFELEAAKVRNYENIPAASISIDKFLNLQTLLNQKTNDSDIIALTRVGGLDAALALKAPIDSPSFTGTVTGIDKHMVGLDRVDNTTDMEKPVSVLTLLKLAEKAPIDSPSFTGTVTGITQDMVGLDRVDNTTDLEKPISTLTAAALALKAPINSPSFTGTVSGITSTMVGLGKVDNTTDLEKPISTLTAAALALKAPFSAIGNDANYATTVDTALAGKASLTGCTFTGVVNGITKDMVGLNRINNTNDLEKPVSNPTLQALALKAPLTALNNDLNYSTTIANQMTAINTALATKAPSAAPTLTGITTMADAVVNGSFTINQNVANNNVYTKTDVNALLIAKQDTIADNSLPISKITNLQTILNNKAPFSAIGDDPNYATTIGNQITAINTALAGKISSSSSSSPTITGTCAIDNLNVSGAFNINQNGNNNVYTKTDITGLLANKQDALTDGSITISKVIGLQTQLNNKAPFSALGDDPNYAATIYAQMTAMNTAIAGKVSAASPTITGTTTMATLNLSGPLTINAAAANNVYTKSDISTLLNGKQDTIADGSLSIAKIYNLQATLNNKAPFSALGDDPNYATTIATQLAAINNTISSLASSSSGTFTGTTT